MVSAQIDHVLRDLESFFKCPLKTNSGNTCCIRMSSGLSVQIRLDRTGFLLVGCKLGSVHMGRFFKELVRAALNSNDLTSLDSGVFGFSHKSNQLILFMRIPIEKLSSYELLALFPPFIEKAKMWHNAIAKNEIPKIKEENKHSTGLFGLVS